MTTRRPVDPDAITCAEAAHALGTSPRAVTRLRREGILIEVRGKQRKYSRSEVEALARDPFVNGNVAARILGVVHSRVSQLAAAGKLPFILTRSGKRLYRASQLQLVANARAVRFHGRPLAQ